jgi:lipid-A-disaccharide synthase
MSGRTFMFVAGEPSGDALAAELVGALRRALADEPFAPRFFGAGGPRLAAAGAELHVDLTRHAVTGLAEIFRHLLRFRRLLAELTTLACTRQPEVVVLVDFQAFNRCLARALRRRAGPPGDWFHNWRPRLVQYVSPQVWASRPGRARALARDLDLLLCLFPFEAEWYARHEPRLRVVAVGHPLLDRHPPPRPEARHAAEHAPEPEVLLLPGSRAGELRRHLPVMLAAARQLAAQRPARFSLVLPEETLRELARGLLAGTGVNVAVQVGGMIEALDRAAVALASTGTVTLECALRGVPTVALYRTAPLTYWVGRRLATVKYLAMPNLLAGGEVMPEFIQDAATPEHLARAAQDFLADPARREAYRRQCAAVVAKLGEPGASRRAAEAIVALLRSEK